MEHRLNTERESAQLHLERLFWDSVFHPCSIRGSPENFVGNERFSRRRLGSLPHLMTVRRHLRCSAVGGATTLLGSSQWRLGRVLCCCCVLWHSFLRTSEAQS